MAGLARWCFHHRRIVLALWLVALIGFGGVDRAVGASYANNFSLPATDSSRALDILKADFPSQSGDTEQVVLQAKHGTLNDPATKAEVEAMLARVAELPHVRAVTSPYGPGGQISKDGTIGLATVYMDALAQNVPKSAVSDLISTAKSADSSVLNVQLGGNAIENNRQSGQPASEGLGIIFAAHRAVLRLPTLVPVRPAAPHLRPGGHRGGTSIIGDSHARPGRTRSSDRSWPRWWPSASGSTTPSSSSAAIAMGCWPGAHLRTPPSWPSTPPGELSSSPG